MRLNIKTKFLSVILITSLLIIVSLSAIHYFFENKLASKYATHTITTLEGIAEKNIEISNRSLTPFTERYLLLAVDDIADEIMLLKHKNSKINNNLIRNDRKLRSLINKYSFIGNNEIIRIVVIDAKNVVLSIDPAEEGKNYQHWIDRCPELENYIHNDKNIAGYYNFKIDNKITPVHINVFQIPNTDYTVIAFLNLSKYLAHSNLLKREKLTSEIVKLEKTTSSFRDETILKMGFITFIIVVIILIICIPISLYLATTLTKPIRLLRDKVYKIAKGNFDVRIKEQGSREVVDLIKAFNSLGKELQEYVRNLKKEIKAREIVENEIKIAAKIQYSLLPEVTEKYKHNNFSLAALLNSAKEASGDFYDFFYIGENKIALLIADVSGKGIPAAFFMALSKTVIRNICEGEPDPAEALKKTNNIISTNNKEFMFVTAFLMYYDYTTGKAEYANAGHHEAIIASTKNDELKYFGKFNDTVMGFIKDFPYKKGEIILDKNDTLILFTDGITEAYSPDKEQFGEKRLEKVILSTKSSSVDNMCSGIIKKVRSFEDNKHFDDATILIFRRD